MVKIQGKLLTWFSRLIRISAWLVSFVALLSIGVGYIYITPEVTDSGLLLLIPAVVLHIIGIFVRRLR